MRLHQLEALVKSHAPDVIGLQETKVTDQDFPVESIEALGYQVVFHGQKTHYGVATLSKHPIINTTKGFPSDSPESQKRFIATEIDYCGQPIHILNGYFPQGESEHHPEKFPNKARFYIELQNFLKEHFSDQDPLLVLGDMNISHQDIDIGIGDDNRKRWLRTGKCSFLPVERQWFND